MCIQCLSESGYMNEILFALLIYAMFTHMNEILFVYIQYFKYLIRLIYFFLSLLTLIPYAVRC